MVMSGNEWYSTKNPNMLKLLFKRYFNIYINL